MQPFNGDVLGGPIASPGQNQLKSYFGELYVWRHWL